MAPEEDGHANSHSVSHETVQNADIKAMAEHTPKDLQQVLNFKNKKN